MARRAFAPFIRMHAAEDRKVLTVVLTKISLLASGMARVAFTALIRISLDAGVLRIRVRLIVFVAGETGKILTALRIGMARCTLAPFIRMHAAEDRKVLTVVLAKISLLAGGMTAKASRTCIRISSHTPMFIIHFRLCMFMTIQTGKFSKGR